jgi:hypothetical protein
MTKFIFVALLLLGKIVLAEQLESLPACQYSRDANGLVSVEEFTSKVDCITPVNTQIVLNYVIVDDLGHPVDSEDYGKCKHYDTKEYQESHPLEIRKLVALKGILDGHPEATTLKIEFYRNGKEKGTYPSLKKICSYIQALNPNIQKCIGGKTYNGYPRIVVNISR